MDQRLADIEAGDVVPETEAGSDLRPRQVVGGIAERSYRQSMMMSGEDALIFLQRPACVVLILAVVISLALSNLGVLRAWRSRSADSR